MGQEIAFAWSLKEKDPKRARLHQKLFGQKVTKIVGGRKKTYTYKGVFYKWVDGERVVDCHHTILGESLISIPDMEKEFVPQIRAIFKELDIPLRQLVIVKNSFTTWEDGEN